MREATCSSRVGALGALIILAVLFTAGVHVYLAVSPTSPEPNLRGLFLLDALAYLAGLSALYAPLQFMERVRWPARLGLLALTVGTIVGYFVVMGFVFDTLAIVDKSVEAFLVVALIADAMRAFGASRGTGGIAVGREETQGRAAA